MLNPLQTHVPALFATVQNALPDRQLSHILQERHFPYMDHGGAQPVVETDEVLKFCSQFAGK